VAKSLQWLAPALTRFSEAARNKWQRACNLSGVMPFMTVCTCFAQAQNNKLRRVLESIGGLGKNFQSKIKDDVESFAKLASPVSPQHRAAVQTDRFPSTSFGPKTSSSHS
jgi:hypothetical protein